MTVPDSGEGERVVDLIVVDREGILVRENKEGRGLGTTTFVALCQHLQ